MTEFTVTWKTTIVADTPEDAARKAWAILRRPDSMADVFDVEPLAGESCWMRKTVDLAEVGRHIEVDAVTEAHVAYQQAIQAVRARDAKRAAEAKAHVRAD